MAKFGALIASYGQPLALAAVLAVVIIALVWRARERRIRREQQRVRRLARQRVWDWLMLRPQVRRLTYRPEDDQI